MKLVEWKSFVFFTLQAAWFQTFILIKLQGGTIRELLIAGCEWQFELCRWHAKRFYAASNPFYVQPIWFQVSSFQRKKFPFQRFQSEK